MPISTIAYSTIPRNLNGDASALFTMSRNVIGAIGISIANSQVTERTQIREAYLSRWTTPFRQGYESLLSRTEASARAAGVSSARVDATAMNQVHSQFIEQAQVLAYNDVFGMVAVLAFLVVPFCFLLSNSKAGGAPGGGH